MNKHFALAVSLLSGVIIGAGVFSLPFIFSKVGMLAGALFLVAFTIVYIGAHLMYGDVVLRTKEDHRFAGYARLYLGAWGYAATVLMTVIGMMFVLAVYLVLSGTFSAVLGLSSEAWGVYLWWVLGSLPLFLNIRKLATVELIAIGAMIAIIAFIFIASLPAERTFSYVEPLDWRLFFLPFGSLLFALSGRSAIPQMVRYFKNNPSFSLSKAIVVGTIIPAALYLLFIYGVIVLSGSAVSEDALSGMMGHPWLMMLAAALGILNVWTSYIIVGRDVKESLTLDMKWNPFVAGALVVVAPILIYALGFKQFFSLIDFTGGLFLGFEGLLIALMWQRFSKFRYKYFISLPVALVFAASIVYQVVSKLV